MATIAENIQTLRSIKSGIKQAITDKGGSVGNDFKTYAQAITDLPSGGGGGTKIEDGLITRKLSGIYYNDRISVVGEYAFYSCVHLTSVNLPNCKNIRPNAFISCRSLISVNLPNCVYVNGDAFNSCIKLVSVNLPLCKYIYGTAFGYCYSLSSVNLPSCIMVYDWAFRFCSALTSINIPLCSTIGRLAFQSCNNLSQVYLNSVSSVTTISSNTFLECPNLTSVYVPASLVDAFKTAQYWTSISNKIVAYTGPQISTGDML